MKHSYKALSERDTVFGQIPDDHIRRILVRGPNWVGDAVMCTPALQGIRQEFPSAEITLLARSAVANLMKAHGSVDETMVDEHQSQHAGIAGKWRLARALQAKLALPCV